ncbi:hypothetical protein CJU81_10555 [Pseudomonas fragi]|uniref:Uncharacterized protein n=1 Tax=Pseudomonas fragi TaxID=296 RepID=A0A267AL21_PSEFR|nr:hypothetical protein CJU81_10555 [Pseudomonas fragi]
MEPVVAEERSEVAIGCEAVVKPGNPEIQAHRVKRFTSASRSIAASLRSSATTKSWIFASYDANLSIDDMLYITIEN